MGKEILMNQEVITINQDPLISAGDRIKGTDTTGQVWMRNLHNGDKAVVFYHPAGEFAMGNMEVFVAWSELGWLDSDNVVVRDLWERKTIGTQLQGFKSTLAPRDVMFLRLARQSRTIV